MLCLYDRDILLYDRDILLIVGNSELSTLIVPVMQKRYIVDIYMEKTEIVVCFMFLRVIKINEYFICFGGWGVCVY